MIAQPDKRFVSTWRRLPLFISLAVMAMLASALVWATVPAHAAQKTINGYIGGDVGDAGGLFNAPRDVAVYTAGDSDPGNDRIFVTEGDTQDERNRDRIQRLDVHGNFELLWGKDVIVPGAPGDTGTGAEVCREDLSGAANCQFVIGGSAEGELSRVEGIAVNQTTGHVYVVDRDNRRVQEFDLEGTFVRTWGWGVDTGAAAFEICTAGCQAGLPGSGAGQFQVTDAQGVGIAIDPIDGDVFVSDPGNGRVQQFSSSGAFVAAFGTPDSGLGGPGEFGFGEPRWLAVDSNRILYVSDSNGPNRVQRYDTEAGVFLEPIACCDPGTPGAPLIDGVTVGLEIDPDSDGPGADEEHLLVGRDPFDGDTVVQELDIPTPATDPVTTVTGVHVYAVDPESPSADEARTVVGIGSNPTDGNLYLATPSIRTPLSGIGTFTGCEVDRCVGLIVLSSDSGPLGAVVAGAGAEGTSLLVQGSANAGGGVASYRFETSTDGSTWQDSGAGGYVSGLDDEPVSGELTGLQPNTPYRVRLVVRKQNGFTTNASAVSNELVVLTDAFPPAVETLGSTERTDRGATLQASIDPNGADTTYRFEYGLAGGSFDRHVPIPDGLAGAGNSPRRVAAAVSGLQPETTYQYRIVATNFAGTSIGEVVQFRTDATELPRPPAGRGYELVSPADKVGGTGVGQWYQGPGTSALVGYGAHVGERFAVLGFLGSVLVDGPYTYSTDWALAERTPAGWVSRPGMSRRAFGSQAKADLSMLGAAEDLSLSAWGSAHLLRLFPEMESWIRESVDNPVTFLRDWTDGQWEVFGPTDQSQGNTSIGNSLVAADGSAAVISTTTMRGLAGSRDPTLENGTPGDSGSPGSIYLEEVADGMRDAFPGDDGVRELVNVCTDGTVLPAVIDPGGGDPPKQGAEDCPAPPQHLDRTLTSPQGAALGEDTAGVISADGSRVFFMSPDPRAGRTTCEGAGPDAVCPPQLFVWQRNPGGDAVTRWISRTEVSASNGAAADQDASLMGPALFEGASADGDKVFFRTSSPLTADDPNGVPGGPPAGGVTTGDASDESWDLYMYDLPDTGDPAAGDLVRISGGPQGSGDCNSSTGTLRFVSEDGSRAYFTCAAPLPGVSTPDDGTITAPGGSPGAVDGSNLYQYDAARPAARRWRFIARLPRGGALGQCATTENTRSSRCFHGTSDGSLVTFLTAGRLTGDDPDEVSGDIYGYDAVRDELTRLSAPQGGVGVAYDCRVGVPCYGDDGFRSGTLPLERLGVALRPDGDRLAFFESRSRLVPEDTDQAYDVYGWRDGDLSLISTGRSATDGAFFAGNDKSGLNVYIATRDRLTWQDKDAVLDIYTARVGGGIPEPPPHQVCQLAGDGCQGPGAAGPGQAPIASKRPAGGNASPERPSVRIAALSARARRAAARTGVVKLRMTVATPGTLVVSAKARISGKARRVAGVRRRVAKAGDVAVRLRLNRAARRRLQAGKALGLRITAGVQGARQATIGLTLKRGRR